MIVTVTELAGTRTHDHLLAAFARESQTTHRYLWFAQQADVDGRPDAAAVFRALAESETGHAAGHLEFLADVADPITGAPITDTTERLAAASAAEAREAADLYPRWADVAREEGLGEVADWFDNVAAADRRHAERLADLR